MKITMPGRILVVAAIMIIAANIAFCSCSKNEKPTVSAAPVTPDTTELKPAPGGRLIYHSYSCYSCNDSKMYLYNFATNTNSFLSGGWSIDNPMNAHFSPDGTKIVFMGLQKGTANWDVFLWTLGSASQPINLTAALGNSRDEDPKFSNSGDRIVFKHSGHLAEMDLNGNLVRNITSGTGEESMPYYTYNDSAVLYAAGGGEGGDIFMINTNGTAIKSMAAVTGLQEYFPIARDNVSYFYTRWASASNHNDQLYLGYYNTTKTALRLPFNTPDANYSDAYPYGENYVFLSATKADSKGGYDLYIANISTGKIWSLSTYNAAINSVHEELGATYTPY